MKWKGRRMSGNVIDSRRSSGSGKIIGGGVGVLVLAVIVYFLGGDPGQVLQQAGNIGTETNYEPTAAENEAADFVKVVLAETEDYWQKQFADMGKEYRQPELELFHGQINSACGGATSAVGPFYCPTNQRIYIDLDFYNELHNRFGAPGDFAMAYVIAHEVGHHVQTILGISEKVRALKERNSERDANRLSVMQELQADFMAGMWAHDADRTQGILDVGDIEEALNAAEAIGDDKLQKQSQGYVVPDAFTHGTSAQRQYWFKKGYETGDITQGDTFNADDL
jgi:predicted metalloprotease